MFFLAFCFVPNSVLAQKISVTAKIDSSVIWIGSQTILSFEVSQLPNQKVVMPLFSDTVVKGLELVEPVKNDTVNSADGHLLVSQRCKITSFHDSLLYIPPYPFVLNGDTVWSKSLSLKVIQPFKIDTTSNSIADIKPVFNPKFDWRGLLNILLWVLLALLIIALTYVLIQKYWRKKPVFASAPKPILPPHVIAISHLDKIKQEKPWQQGRFKEYHTELTDVVRAYLEVVFDIRSMEMTSDEILDQLKVLRIENKAAYLSLQQIMKLADLVKFAKWHTTPDEHELSLYNAYQFVNLTKVDVEVINESTVVPDTN